MAKITITGPNSPVLSKEEMAALLKVSEATLDRWIVAGRFPVGVKVMPGSPPIWSNVDLACWIHLVMRMNTPTDDVGKAAKKAAEEHG